MKIALYAQNKKTHHHWLAQFGSAVLAFAFMIQSAPAPLAAEASDPLTDFEITLAGEKVEGTEYYGGTVTVNIKLKGNSKENTLWIDETGVWKLITSNEQNAASYAIPFAKDGAYDLDFRVENKQTLNKTINNVQFTVSSAMQNALTAIAELPDPASAPDELVIGAKEKIIAQVNAVNSLRSRQREAIPKSSIEKLDSLQKKLTSLDSAGNHASPAAVQAEIKGEYGEVGGLKYYRGTATLSAKAGNNTVLIHDGSQWKPMEGGTLTLTEAGEYHLDICSESASNVRSPAVSFDFYVDPDIPALVEEVDNLYSNAQNIDQQEYVTGLERLYKQYLEFSPLRQSLLPTRTADRLIYMHDYILEQLKFNNKAEDASGRYIMAVGMYGALNIPKLNLGSDAVSLVAERAEKVSDLTSATGGKAVAEYRLSFSCPGMEQENLPIDAADPIKICLQVPDDLKGKKNIDMLYVEDGKDPVSLAAKVRSTEDNLVMYFSITKPGKYVFTAVE